MANTNELAKKASVADVILHYVTSVLGLGLIISPGLSFYLAGNQALYTWILLTTVSIPIAFIFVWIALKYGASSSISLVVGETLGNFPATFVSYCVILTMFVGNPIICLTSARHIVNLLSLPNQSVIPIAIALTILSLICVSFDLRKFFNIQHVFTSVFVIIFVVGSLISIYTNVDELRIPIPSTSSIDAISVTFFVCFLAFTGWENGITIVEEIKNAKNVLYIGAIFSSIILLLIYLLSFYAIQPYVDRSGLEDESINALQRLFTILFGNLGAIIIGILVPIILFLSANAWLYGTSRLIYSMGKRNFLPKFFWQTVSDGKIPKRVLLIMFVAYTLTFFLFYYFSLTIHDLVFLYSFGSYIVFLFVFLSGVLIFKSGQKLTTLLVFILCMGLMFHLEFKIELAAIFIAACLVASIFSWRSKI